MFITSLVTLIVIGHVAVASANCPLDEYRMESECCPACPAGKRVEKDCTEHSITKCTSCTGGTFNGRLNGKKKCSPCTQCEAGLGLKVKESCILTSDALCEPLDGYFCTDFNRGGCMAAQRHKVCSPGQYISQTGTADKDTECLQCPNGTFSDGTSTSCQNHTKCSSDGLVQIKPGTSSTDSECVERALGAGATAGIIIGIILGILMVVIGVIVLAYQRRRKRRADRGHEPETSSTKSRDSPVPPSDLREYTTVMNDVTMTDQESGSIPSGHTNGAMPMKTIHSPATTDHPNGLATMNHAVNMNDHDGDQQSVDPAPPSGHTNGAIPMGVHQGRAETFGGEVEHEFETPYRNIPCNIMGATHIHKACNIESQHTISLSTPHIFIRGQCNRHLTF